MQKQTLIEKLATWVDQQQKIGLNPTDKITEFNRLKDNYNSTAANLSGSEEMQQLIKLLVNVSESHWSEVKEAIEKSLLARIAAIKIPLASDEQILHFFLPNSELIDTTKPCGHPPRPLASPAAMRKGRGFHTPYTLRPFTL